MFFADTMSAKSSSGIRSRDPNSSKYLSSTDRSHDRKICICSVADRHCSDCAWSASTTGDAIGSGTDRRSIAHTASAEKAFPLKRFRRSSVTSALPKAFETPAFNPRFRRSLTSHEARTVR